MDKPYPLDSVTARGWKHNSSVLFAFITSIEILLLICAIIHMSSDPECSRAFLTVGALFAVALAGANMLVVLYSCYPRNFVFFLGAIVAIILTIAYAIYVNEYFKEEWRELHLGKKERRSSEDFDNDIIIAAIVFCAF